MKHSPLRDIRLPVRLLSFAAHLSLAHQRPPEAGSGLGRLGDGVLPVPLPVHASLSELCHLQRLHRRSARPPQGTFPSPSSLLWCSSAAASSFRLAFFSVRSLTTQDAIHQTNMKEMAECKELFSQLVRYRGELQQMHQKVEAAMETLKKGKASKEVRYSLQKKKKKLQRKLENTHCPCG
jgi:hypothetical protein